MTNLTKVAGLAVSVNEVFLRGALRPLVFAGAMFMLAGAHLSEEPLLAVVDRLIGGPPRPAGPVDREPEG